MTPPWPITRATKESLAFGSDGPDRMAEARDEVVWQGPGLKKMGYSPDREGDRVADHAHSYTPREDSRSQASYFHDIRDVCNALLTGFS